MTYVEEIQNQRKEIDRIDGEIIQKIVKRVKLAKEIGKIKKRYKKLLSLKHYQQY